MIAIVNYGMGNLGSISNMLKKIGADAESELRPREHPPCAQADTSRSRCI